MSSALIAPLTLPADEVALQGCLDRLKVYPEDGDVLLEAAALCLRLKIPQGAAEFSRKVIRRTPEAGIAHFMLGRALAEQGDWSGAMAAHRKGLLLDPRNSAAKARLAEALLNLGRDREAEIHLHEALESDDPTQATLSLLASLLSRLGRRESALEVCRRALALGEDGEISAQLATLLEATGAFGPALTHFERAAEMEPQIASIKAGLAGALLTMGDAERGLPLLHAAIALAPENRDWVTGGIFTLSTDPEMNLERAYVNTTTWMNGAYPSQTPCFALNHDRHPERRLRIGYVSPDFRGHAMAHWIAPLLEDRDRANFEILCFSETSQRDESTKRFKSLADRWVQTAGLSAEALAARIVALKVDILVDLAGHTAGNRLDAFNLKPAPVQVMMLGFDRTSGLRAMDWRITTDNSESGDADRWSTERIWRLNGRFCYKPLEDAPGVSPSPFTRNGFLTFGFLGNHARVGSAYLSAAARLLLEIPDARLMLLCREGDDEAHLAFKRSFFLAAGVNPERILFRPRTNPETRFLAYYQDVDITLNSFPAEGGTTICESLWMGVPVLALDRPEALRHAGRGLLEYLGMADWVTSDLDAWLQIAKSWDRNRDGLDALRRGLRERMVRSPLCDGPSAMRAIEEAYRGMWRAWCAQGS